MKLPFPLQVLRERVLMPILCWTSPKIALIGNLQHVSTDDAVPNFGSGSTGNRHERLYRGKRPTDIFLLLTDGCRVVKR